MTSRQVIANTTLLALSLFPQCVSAQSFHLVSQDGSVNASAFVSGPAGATSDSEGKNGASSGVIDVFAGAGASLPEMFASATAHLQASLTSRTITMSGVLDGNGAATFSDVQSAGGSGGANIAINFTVDRPVLVRLVGETTGVWTGDAGIEPSISLYSAHSYLADVNGPGGGIEFEGILIPAELYTLSAFGVASAVTSEFNSFGSAQGGFSARLELIAAAAVPEPGSLALLGGMGILGSRLLLSRRQRGSASGQNAN